MISRKKHHLNLFLANIAAKVITLAGLFYYKPKFIRYAITGIKLALNASPPIIIEMPNSVILTPCL